jgi:hypothetical protein
MDCAYRIRRRVAVKGAPESHFLNPESQFAMT